ncbi:MAG: DUF4238 domain-containing protein [Terracidiphilus sp.]|jgi:hypothetical protein
MQSHTVPRKLLEQFAYDDPLTNAKRLWRYEKGRDPYWKASPRTATRIDRHFHDPEDASKEAGVEERLNREFEEPVNRFLFEIGSPDFVSTDERRRQLTFYVTLLFNRSEARRKASAHLQKIVDSAVKCFLENEIQVETVAAKWSIDLLLSGQLTGGLITKEHVIARTLAYAREVSPAIRAQQSYVRTVEGAMSTIDDKLLAGEWNYIRTVATDPFVISDAPVVTWERLPDGRFSHGMGFHRANVEVLLPISPLVCLHIQPQVERARPCKRPSVREVNTAQAAFAARYCFSNVKSGEINHIVQENLGKAELGVKGFTVWHRNYKNTIYDILMSGGQWVEPPRR